jgi:hypothetical protein
MSLNGRFCGSLLKAIALGDSVVVMRFATGAEHDEFTLDAIAQNLRLAKLIVRPPPAIEGSLG